MGELKSRYTTINVYPDDRDQAKEVKKDDETWSQFLMRTADALGTDTKDQTDADNER